jgi:hypothetical protein
MLFTAGLFKSCLGAVVFMQAHVPCALQALAESREWHLLEKQLATTKGFRMLQTCQMVLRHTQAVAGLLPPTLQVLELDSADTSASADSDRTAEAAAAARACHTATQPDSQGGAPCNTGVMLECKARRLLGCMCEERLMPTYWLNEVRSGQVVLLLN